MIGYSVIQMILCTVVLFIRSSALLHNFPVVRKINYTEDVYTIIHNMYRVAGPKEEVVMSVFDAKTNDQLQKLKAEYNNITSQDLSDDCYSLLESNLGLLVRDLLIPKNEYYAHKLYDAMDGLGTDEAALTEILCPMNKTEILEVSAVYENLYGSTLREDVMSETSGTYQHLLLSLCDVLRPDDDTEINYHAADLDVITLNDSMVDKWTGTLMEMDYINIFATRSFRQLRVVFDKFEAVTKIPIRQVLKERIYDNIYYGLSAIEQTVYSKATYLAQQFEVSMLGIGTDNQQLVRLVVGRSEIDLPEIRDAYFIKYNTKLVDRIRDDAGGSYGTLLCNIVEK